MCHVGSCARCAGSGMRTEKTMPAPLNAVSGLAAISAPAAAKSWSEIDACAPAPASTTTLRPRPISFLTVSGVAATRVSEARRSFSTARRIASYPSSIRGNGRANSRPITPDPWTGVNARGMHALQGGKPQISPEISPGPCRDDANAALQHGRRATFHGRSSPCCARDATPAGPFSTATNARTASGCGDC